MSDRLPVLHPIAKHFGICVPGVALIAASALLAGCAGMGDGAASGAFVDPAKYELYDCKQLETERASLESQSRDMRGRMDKAETGVGGAVVSQAVYGTDYVKLRARLKLANQTWDRNRCVALAPTPVTPPPLVRRR